MKRKRVRLTKSNDYTFNGAARYYLVLNQEAGRKNVYDVFVRTSGDPVRIGCELPLDLCRQIIDEFDVIAHKQMYFGSRAEAQDISDKVATKRRKK